MDGDNATSWSDLPADLGAAIAGNLTELADLARFRSVCPSWRSASAAHAARLRVPLLLVPTQRFGPLTNRRFWSLADDRIRQIPVPAARHSSFLFGSRHGWTLAVGAHLSAVLVHPFTGTSAGLPALPFPGRESMPRDLVWDWSPHGVVVSPGDGAFVCRHGDASWTPLDCSSPGGGVVSSITYCDGAFYLFDGKTCKVTVVDSATFAVAAVIEPPALVFPEDFEANLAVSPDELLLFVRTELLHRGRTGWPPTAKAFRADRAAGGGWSEAVSGIGDRAVFVDHFHAFCVEASGFNGVRRNCMYVASSYEAVNDDYGMDISGHYIVSVLDLADLTTKHLDYGNLCKVRCTNFWQWPSWSLPNPQ